MKSKFNLCHRLYLTTALTGMVFMHPSASFAIGSLETPAGGVVVGGSSSISSPAPGTLNIIQSTNRSVINWNTFNIGKDATTQFFQPSASSLSVERVTSGNPAKILGTLKANGNVMILDSNGVLFGRNSVVDVNGIVAAAGNVSTAEVMSGARRIHIQNIGKGAVENEGTITVAEAGLAAFVAPTVRNSGTITANLGSVTLGAGKNAVVDLYGDGLFSIAVGDKIDHALVENSGSIIAHGGQVAMTAETAAGLVDNAINNTGIVEASSLTAKGGEIILSGGNISDSGKLKASGATGGGTIKLLGNMQAGHVNVSGMLDASAPKSGDGGLVETSAAHVNIADYAKIDTSAASGNTGQWIVDPNNYTIAASGGDITGTALSNNLNSTNVTILSSSGARAGHGDINVNDPVSWAANTELTLSAYGSIYVNANITATGNTAGLTLTPNTGGKGGSYALNNGANITLSGADPSLNIAGKEYAVINSLTALQDMNNNLAGYYALGSDIDATATGTWNGGAGFVPVGTNGTAFTGRLDGLGHTVSNLFINRPNQDYVGLFGSGTGGISNVGLADENISGKGTVGGLTGYNSGVIKNSYTTGAITGGGTDPAGGLVGFNAGSIIDSYSASAVGGAIGNGGLAGNNTGTISYSYAIGNVSGANAGGLAGFNNGTISYSYATGSVHGSSGYTGGLVAANNKTIANSYATGSVSGPSAGGLAGLNGGRINDSLSTGNVSGSTGGLVGTSTSGAVTNHSYWDTITSGQSTSVGGTGLTTAQLSAALPGGFSSAVWGNVNNQTTPYLRSNPGPVYIGSDSAHLFSLVTNMQQLQAINDNLSGNYALTASLQGRGITDWVPLGNSVNNFTGIFDGLGKTIANLTINRPSEEAGLFGYSSGVIRNIGLTDETAGGGNVGGLVDVNNGGTVSNSYSIGNVSGIFAGGLIRFNGNGGTVSDSYFRGSVSSREGGGLVEINDGTIINSHTIAKVTGSDGVAGGLAGENNGVIKHSYATGNVSAAVGVGGLVGDNNGGTIEESYATGGVSGTSVLGGLAGGNEGTIINSYATGKVSGFLNQPLPVGGLVGNSSGSVINSYSTGRVINGKGLLGLNSGTVTSSYWDTQTSHQATSAGGTGLTTSQMMMQSSFAGWDFTNVWMIDEGVTRPVLR